MSIAFALGRSGGKTLLPLTVRGALVLALPAVVLLAAMALTWSTLVEEGHARRDLNSLIAVHNDLAATASLVRRVSNGVDLYVAARLRGDLMPFHLASDRLTALTAAVRTRTEELPAGERDSLRQHVEMLARQTLARLHAIDQPLVPLDRTHAVISHDLRQAADELLAEHARALHARAAALIELHERRVSMMLWGGGATLCAALVTIAWFTVRVSRRLELLLANGSQLAAGLPLLALPLGHDELGSLAQDFERARDLLRLYEEELLKADGRQRYLAAAVGAVAQRPAEDGTFLARADAELRTPLTVILSSVELLRDAPLSSEQLASADAIQRSATLLSEFLTETVELARADTREAATDLHPENVALDDMVRDVVRQVGSERGISVDVQVDPKLAVRADRRRLGVVIQALVSNGVKFNRSDGHVWVSAEDRQDGSVRVAIRDTGPGIRREDIGRLFAPFGRLGDAPDGPEGSGLGLAVVKRLVDLMGGAVGVESERRTGSTFWVQFPRAERPPAGVMAASGGARVESSDPQGGIRSVLYIEDRAEMAQLLERILRNRPDLRLVSAVTGAQGLESAAAELPIVILLDLNLPDMRGDEVLARLKADPRVRDIPVVIVSGVADEQRRTDLLTAGASGYVIKPFTISQIRGILPAAA